ncbi:MAG: glycoside hydrolase family 57 protein [Nitrososphaerales archaeon]
MSKRILISFILIKTNAYHINGLKTLIHSEGQKKDKLIDGKSICLSLIIHQPIKLNRNFPYERIKRMAEGETLMDRYFDDKLNQEVFNKLLKKCYNPTFNVLMEMMNSTEKSDKPFKLSLFLSGLFIEQAIRYKPEFIEFLRRLVAKNHIEILGGNYYNSLASVYSGDKTEFIEQAKIHRDLMIRLFGVEPNVFQNTELIYNDSIAKAVGKIGYEGILTEGADNILGARSPNYVYSSPGERGVKILFRHHRLSDDIRFRFSDKTWNEFPLTVEKFCDWLAATPGEVISIVLEIETFGEYNSEDTGIFDFLKKLSIGVAKKNLRWSTPTEVIKENQPNGTIIVPEVETISWVNNKDMSPWLENPMQRISFDRIQNLAPYIKEINDIGIIKIWRLFQQSDHLLYMSTKKELESAKLYYSHYSSPAEAFAVFNSAFTDFEGKVATIVQRIRKSKIQQTQQVPIAKNNDGKP